MEAKTDYAVHMATTRPLGNAFVTSPEQHITLEHGSFQFSTRCKQAHVKVHPMSDLVEVVGKSPELAIPLIEDWTSADGAPPPARKRARR